MSESTELERIEALRQRHPSRRGPIWCDPQAVQRLQQKANQERPAFRVVVRSSDSASLEQHLLDEALASLLGGGAVIRLFRRRIALESDARITSEQVGILRSVAQQCLTLLHRRCPRCRSKSIEVVSRRQRPRWGLRCRRCLATVRRPNQLLFSFHPF